MLGRWERLLLNTLPAPLQAGLRGAHAANKAIVRSAFWLVLFMLAAKLVAAGKEMAIAYRYGTSATVEGYLFVFNLLLWLASSSWARRVLSTRFCSRICPAAIWRPTAMTSAVH